MKSSARSGLKVYLQKYEAGDVVFCPKLCQNLYQVADYTAVINPTVQTAAYYLESGFLGKLKVLSRQTSWMGRGCFLELPSQGLHKQAYLVAKGVGPGAGSELTRRRWDKTLYRQHNERGGCLRLDTGTDYPLLIQVQETNNGFWKGSHPRPEGFSSFRNLVREVETSFLLGQIDIPIPMPLILLRNRLEAPWEETRSGLERYLLPLLGPIILKHFFQDKGTLPSKSVSVYPHIQGLSYLDLDGGILIRLAQSPYRVANLSSAVLDNEVETFRFLVEHFVNLFKDHQQDECDLDSIVSMYTVSLAKTAAILFCEGIIHGQLHLHFQNITLAAEVVDWDCAIFAAPAAIKHGKIPFSPSILQSEYDLFWERILRLMKQWEIDIIPLLKSDYKIVAGITPHGIHEPILAYSMLRQVYDFYNHALRVADLLQQMNIQKKRQGDILLESHKRDRLRLVFKHSFSEQIAVRRSIPLLKWSLGQGYESFIQTTLDCQTTQPTYTWIGYSCLKQEVCQLFEFV